LLVTHPAFAAHDPGPFIVERPARLRAIDQTLSQSKFDGLIRQDAPLRNDVEEAILRAHTQAHFDALRTIAHDTAQLPHAIDEDTVLSSGSWEAALRAVGAGLQATDAVLESTKNIKNAFCSVRPPGHHAETELVISPPNSHLVGHTANVDG
jgi:acetoin utilization deacetylase AcuC-like enzyme